VRNEAALVVLAAAFLVAMTQLLERPATQRLPIRSSSRRRVDEREPEARAGTGLAGRLAGGGMVAATVGLIGQLAAPAAEPLWLALIAAAFASLPAALAAPRLQARWGAKARRRRGSSADWS
jgi:hypothetical protein